MKIWIRADANNRIGTGHVMRCLSLSKALKQQGADITFVTCEDAAEELVAAKGYPVLRISGIYDDLEKELAEFRGLLEKEMPDFLLLDSYFATLSYQRELRKILPIGIFDDTYRNDLDVDILINYNIFAKTEGFGNVTCAPAFLLGPTYFPLRDEFIKACFTVREKAEKVLISTGGTDSLAMGPQLLQAFLSKRSLDGIEFHIVSGRYNVSLPVLQAIAAEHSNVIIHEQVTNMAELMEQCDIAVAAGGTTMYELGTVGIPTICFAFVDNQEKLAQGFEDQKLVYANGNYLLEGKEMFRRLADSLTELIADHEARIRLHSDCRQLFDGQGADRLAKKICEFINGR